MYIPKSLVISLSLIVTLVHRTSGIRVLMLEVPSPTIAGESVELTCSYDLEGDKLYSVKWYKNDIEFYRYITGDWPPGQFLPIAGIRVDLSKSNKNSVYLKHVDLHSSGIYRCEISAEAPSFNTAEMEKTMKVYVLPNEGPRISGVHSDVKPGDMIYVNCTSAKSKPVAQLRWYVNEVPVDTAKFGDDYETVFSSHRHPDGLETSSLGLKFMLTERHLSQQESVRLKCTSNVSKMYTMSSEAMMTRLLDTVKYTATQSLQHTTGFASRISSFPSLSCLCLLIGFVTRMHSTFLSFHLSLRSHQVEKIATT